MKAYESEPEKTSSEDMETRYSPAPTRGEGGDYTDTQTAEETKGRDIPPDLDYLILGKYRPIKLLGKGGMGRIYLAEHTELRKLVAIKIIGEELSRPGQFITLFKREARSAAKLQHPNIARVFDYGQERGKCFYVMDYVQGSSLAEIIDSSAPLPLKQALGIFRQILEALDHAHKSGILHRDIKPSNILIDKEGSAKLLDFGLARSIFGDDSLTALGQSPGGTPSYMSPEQRKGEATDARTDIYSAGVTLFEMLTKTLPRDVNSPRERLSSDLRKSLSPLQKVRASQVTNMVMKCLDDVGNRYTTADEVLGEVRRIEHGLQQQRWLVGSAAGALAAAGLAVAILLAFNPPKSEAMDPAGYLQKKEFSRAAKLFAQLSMKDPLNVKHRYGLGLSYIGTGELDKAKSEFERIADSFGKKTTADEEGLARVAYATNDESAARKLYEAAVGTGKDHTLLHVTMGDIYLLRGQLDSAIEEYEKALARKPMFAFQLGEAYAALGYALMKKGDYEEAQEAVSKAAKKNPDDDLSRFLRSEIERRTDAERQTRLSALVDDLIQAANRTPEAEAPKEAWESRPTALAILGLKKTGYTSLREGEDEMLVFNFARAMQEAGRVSVVEREVLEALLRELKLGASDLAASEAGLQLRRIYPAGLVAAGTLRGEKGRFGVDLRLVETETTQLKVSISQTQDEGESIPEFAERLAKRLTDKIRETYPLKGKIVKLDEQEATLNIGSKHGLTPGTEMKVVKLPGDEERGKLIVRRVGPDSAVAEIVQPDRGISAEDGAIEIVEKDPE